jgi:hypothetical protein
MDNSEVLSAFVDNEPFDPQELLEALRSPEGRDLLIDFLALRHLTQQDESQRTFPVTSRARRRGLRLLAAAAGLVLALAGGYQLGLVAARSPEEPPAPTRVLTGDDIWLEVSTGGVR